jgi:hypothetical protein
VRLARRGLCCWANILVCVGAALYAGLRLRVAVQAALYKLDLALDLVEFGVCLKLVRMVRVWGSWEGDSTSASSTDAVRIRPKALLESCAAALSRVATNHRAAILSCV